MVNAPNAATPLLKKTINQSQLIRRRPQRPTLRLTPYVWSKLLFWRDAGSTEIGAFGISAPSEPLLLEDVCLVKQRCDWASVEFDDAAVADFFDSQVDAGRQPQQFARVWTHTHPGKSPLPSATDEETFARVFGRCDWALMFILARGGSTYARLQFGVGPGGSLVIPVEIAYDADFPASDKLAWRTEYEQCVQKQVDRWDAWPGDDYAAFESWLDNDELAVFAAEEGIHDASG